MALPILLGDPPANAAAPPGAPQSAAGYHHRSTLSTVRGRVSTDNGLRVLAVRSTPKPKAMPMAGANPTPAPALPHNASEPAEGVAVPAAPAATAASPAATAAPAALRAPAPASQPAVVPSPVSSASSPGRALGQFSVTCYDLAGTTASGAPVGPDVVATDPSVIPLGSRIWISGVGERVALDTGGAIQGHRLDIWLPTYSQCVTWGRQSESVYLIAR